MRQCGEGLYQGKETLTALARGAHLPWRAVPGSVGRDKRSLSERHIPDFGKAMITMTNVPSAL